jgi:hypothetical protein
MTVSLGRTFTTAPELAEAASRDVPVGYVLVFENNVSSVGAGEKCVIRRGSKRIEVFSLGSVPDGYVQAADPAQNAADGTYLQATDFARLQGGEESDKAEIRKYGTRDWLRKAWSGGGLLLLVSSLAALVVAFAALAVLLPSSSNASDSVQVQQVLNAMERSNLKAGWPELATRNETVATACIASLGGSSTGQKTAFGVSCAPPTSRSQREAVIGGIAGLMVAGVAMIGGIRNAYGFQKSP